MQCRVAGAHRFTPLHLGPPVGTPDGPDGDRTHALRELSNAAAREPPFSLALRAREAREQTWAEVKSRIPAGRRAAHS